MKNQINKVNVEKASANVKANSLIALYVLKSVKEKNAGLFNTSLGYGSLFRNSWNSVFHFWTPPNYSVFQIMGYDLSLIHI